MKPVSISRKAIVLLLCVLFVALLPWAALARYTGSENAVARHSALTWSVTTLVALYTGAEGWEEQLTGGVLVQAGMAAAKGEPGSVDPYVGRLLLVRSRYARGDGKGTYLAMNRLTDMLDAHEGAISAKAADAIWDCCYAVTPPALHDVKRHTQGWDTTVNREKCFGAA